MWISSLRKALRDISQIKESYENYVRRRPDGEGEVVPDESTSAADEIMEEPDKQDAAGEVAAEEPAEPVPSQIPCFTT